MRELDGRFTAISMILQRYLRLRVPHVEDIQIKILTLDEEDSLAWFWM